MHYLTRRETLRYTIIDRPCPRHGLVAVGTRCAWCGHRLPVDGIPPIETRRLPFWTWPGELVGRYRAMRAGRMPDPVGLIFGPAVIDLTGYHPATMTPALEDAATIVQPAATERTAALIGTLRAVDQALGAYEASVETYGDRLTHPTDYVDPSILTDDTLAVGIPAISEEIR